MTSLAVAVRKHVVAFEPPLYERKALRAFKRTVLSSIPSPASAQPARAFYGSVAVADAQVFQFLSFLLSPYGYMSYPDKTRHLLTLLVAMSVKQTVPISTLTTLIQWEDGGARYTMSEIASTLMPAVDRVYVLVTYRPRLLLPLYMVSARRAVRFVNAVVALVTANAYVSTLGGGHFLCRHLNRSTLLAKLQIGISMGLKDPVLESKCRVNLMYNALQLGKFKRARGILKREEKVAKQLENSELQSVCHAAKLYLDKMDRLHKEHMLSYRNGRPPTLHDNFYRQRIVQLT